MFFFSSSFFAATATHMHRHIDNKTLPVSQQVYSSFDSLVRNSIVWIQFHIHSNRWRTNGGDRTRVNLRICSIEWWRNNNQIFSWPLMLRPSERVAAARYTIDIYFFTYIFFLTQRRQINNHTTFDRFNSKNCCAFLVSIQIYCVELIVSVWSTRQKSDNWF